MAVDDAVMEILGEYWDDIWAALDARLQGELAELVDELNLRISDDGVAALAQRVVDILTSALPRGHPARLALERSAGQQGVTGYGWGELPGVLSTLSAQMVRQRARDRLLGASALSAEQVRAGGEDPERPFLIRLPGPDGKHRIPAFQFGPDGRVIGLVLDVNKLLGSDGDPWGVADWWLGHNAWLEAPPANLIGRADGLVRHAADAMAAPD